MRIRKHQRRGAVAALLCVLILPLMALLALSIDYGFLLYARTDLQRVSDQAAVAAVRDLVPDHYGDQNLDKVRATVREYVALNLGDDFTVLDADIEIGRYDPATIYDSVDLLQDGVYDAVRVILRRDDMANSSIKLFFARLFGNEEAGIDTVSTAILQKGRHMGPGAAVLPFAIDEKAWDKLQLGDYASIFGDGGIENGSGQKIPGNWGTVDVGAGSNGTSHLSDQILNGLSAGDISHLHTQGQIPNSSYIDATAPLQLTGNPGVSSGLKHAVGNVQGTNKLVPILKKVTGSGNNAVFEVSGWGAVTVIDSKFAGSKNTYIKVQRTYMYDGNLLPSSDLSDSSDAIDGTYTSPALVQ